MESNKKFKLLCTKNLKEIKDMIGLLNRAPLGINGLAAEVEDVENEILLEKTPIDIQESCCESLRAA